MAAGGGSATLMAGDAARNVVPVHDHLEDPGPEVVAQRDLRAGDAHHGHGPLRRRHAQKADQFIT